MSDDPFAVFKEATSPTADEPENKPTRKKRAVQKIIPPKKVAANSKVKEASATHPKTRKPRQAKELRLPISMLLEIGSLSEEESGALLSIGAGLQKLPKKSRQKISAALGKIFG